MVAAQRVSADFAAVRVSGLSKRFGTRVALDDAWLEVRPGSVHGLLGPNGAGKTTLLRLLFGLAAADSGTVEVLGRSPYGNPAAALHGVGGFVEAPAFYPYLSARKNLELLAALDGYAATERVEEVLGAVGLTERGRDRVGGFSTGMKQRLGIAASLLRDPRLLILDEPTNGLDPEAIHELHELIRALAAAGRTALLSSHDMAEVDRLCDSVTILAGGRVRYSGGIRELRGLAAEPTHAMDTSDNEAAAAVAGRLGLAVRTAGDELTLRADFEQLDELVLTLGRAGIAVRRLIRQDTALEALFLRMTAEVGE